MQTDIPVQAALSIPPAEDTDSLLSNGKFRSRVTADINSDNGLNKRLGSASELSPKNRLQIVETDTTTPFDAMTKKQVRDYCLTAVTRSRISAGSNLTDIESKQLAVGLCVLRHYREEFVQVGDDIEIEVMPTEVVQAMNRLKKVVSHGASQTKLDESTNKLSRPLSRRGETAHNNRQAQTRQTAVRQYCIDGINQQKTLMADERDMLLRLCLEDMGVVR